MMYCARYFAVRLILLALLVSLQACGGGGGSSGPGNPADTNNTTNNDSATNTELAGKKIYQEQCASCHGDSGQGISASTSLQNCSSCGDLAAMTSITERTMPLSNPAQCDADCSALVAEYISANFPSNSTTNDNSNSDSSTTDNNNNSDSSTTDNNSSSDNSAVIFSETFEDTNVNSQPANWDNFLNYNYNTTNVADGGTYALVDNSVAYSGKNSIHFKGSLAQIVRKLPANSQHLHLRAFVRMSKQMGNVVGDNHEHIMGIKKTQDANNEVRIGQIKGVLGTNDVPSDNIAPTSDQWESGTALKADTWHCVETALYADSAYDQVHMWVDGKLVHSIESDSDWNNGALGSDWMSDKFNYVMFGFHSFSNNSADVWMDDIVVSTQPIGCDAIAPDNTDSSGTDNSSTGDIAHGQSLYEAQCISCHGADGQGIYPIDASRTTYGDNNQTLVDYINDTMPTKNTADCTGQCATDIAAYLVNWNNSSADTGSNTDDSLSCGVTYGPRMMRVLTRDEFTNSIEDLTGVNIIEDSGKSTYDAIPTDNMIDGFSNNIMASISSGSLQSYQLVVNKVVELLAAQNFKSIIDCSQFDSSDACAASFIENYIPRVFRRPTTEEEQIAFQELFSTDYTGGDVYEGIALALQTIFTSPQFLYRDETGISITDINAGTGDQTNYEPVGDIQTIVDSTAEPKTLAIYNQFGANANFTGNDLITITVKGTKGPENGLWPTMSIEWDKKVIGQVEVNHSYNKTYKFHTTQLSGNQYVAILNKQQNLTDEYKGGHDLIVSKVEISAAQEAVQTIPDVTLDNDAYVLTPYQLASYLSFTFTGSTPDNTLLKAAGEGLLETDAQIAAQVERLLATARARKHFGNFAAQWLRTDRILDMVKDTTIYTNFTDEVRKAMAQEVRDIFNHVVLDEGEPFSSMYDGNFTFANKALADFYGIDGVTGSDMQKVSGVTSRAGLVTSGAFLAVHAHEQETGPILRATYLRKRVLCHNVPAPPTGVSLNVDFDAARQESVAEWEAYLAQNNGLATSRKKYEFQTSAEVCQTCHAQMLNPLGVGFEDFDAVGVPQTQDYNKLTIDSSGVLYGVSGITDSNSISFNGAKEIAHAIAKLDVTRQCFVDNTFRMAMGTGSSYLDRKIDIQLSNEEITSYTCEVKKLDEQMKSSNNSPTALLKALGTMDSVRYRKDVIR